MNISTWYYRQILCINRCEHIKFIMLVYKQDGFPTWLRVKNPPPSAGDVGSTPAWGRSPEKEMAAHSRILAREILWTEEPGGL